MKHTKFLVILIILINMLFLTSAVLAEGSRDLYPGGPNGDRSRANLEWTTNTYGPAGLLARRTILHVYAEATEVLFMGSSAVGIDQGNVLVYAPGQITGPIGGETVGAPAYDCVTQRGVTLEADQGQITSRAMELAGPDTDAGGAVAGGYNPCTFTIPATGIYSIIFYGPDGVNSPDNGGPTGDIAIGGTDNFDVNQDATISSWDVTVRDTLASTIDVRGRLFSYYLSFLTGGNGRRVYSTFFPVTTDGYIYQTETNGFDPNGYLVYGNTFGFFDSDGTTPLYRDVLSTGGFSLPSLEGGAGMQRPQFPIFFNNPDPLALTALGIPLTPIAPVVTNVGFTGSISGNTSLVNSGGTISFTSNVTGVYELILSRDGIDYDPTTLANRVLRGTANPGINNVAWDGLDNQGGSFPVGSYNLRVNVRAGEYHFPLIDAENSVNGGPTYTLINPPGGNCPPFNGGCNSGFYDDRGYTLLNGTTVGTVNVALCGNNPPNPVVSDLLIGFDTTNGDRAFGTGGGGNTNAPCTGAFGDVKGLDLWTYYPGNAAFAPLIIVDTVPPPTPQPPVTTSTTSANPTITKSVNPPFAQPGETVTWTVVIGNPSGQVLTNLTVTDTMPAELSIVSASGDLGTTAVNGQSITYSIPSLNPNQSSILTITVQVRATASVPFELTNLACVNGSICDSATVISISQLPATGQSPYSNVRQLLILLVGLVLVLGTRQTIRRVMA